MQTTIKIGFLAYFIFWTNIGFSQSPFKKGTSLVGISGSYFNDSERQQFDSDNPDIDFFEINEVRYAILPSYAYAIKDNLMLGATLIVEKEEEEIINNPRSFSFFALREVEETSEFGFSLFVRKYYPVKGNFGAFVEPIASFRWEESSIIDEEESSLGPNSMRTVDQFVNQSLGINLGIYYAIKDRFLVETALGGIDFSSRRSRGSNNDDQIFSDFSRNSFTLNLIDDFNFDQILRISFLF